MNAYNTRNTDHIANLRFQRLVDQVKFKMAKRTEYNRVKLGQMKLSGIIDLKCI